mgnify:CR=1 FL=1
MKYRAEIDGLRALAVLPVILFHAGFEWFSGGFVGVDVFFVISGYLITTIIISEMAEGKFSIVNFYERRARRILPALFFVMAACLPFAWLWLTPTGLKDFGQSLVAVSTFSSNILFWLESGYFDNAAELKPLLHTWSLAVEEQYYILFPIFLMLTWRLGIKWILILLSIVFLVSLGVAQWGAYNAPSASFFLLPTRGWELLVGVFAAFYLKYNTHLKSHTVNQMLSLLGFGMIAYSILAFNKTTPFPSLYALIPTIGTGLLILCAVPKTFVHRLLSLKYIVGIGLISYSAYLWHQPLLAFARYKVVGDVSELHLIILCIISFLMAWFSWRFIEAPLRNKKVFNRNAILTYSLLGIIGFSSFGIFLHLNNGFPDRIKFSKELADSFKAPNYDDCFNIPPKNLNKELGIKDLESWGCKLGNKEKENIDFIFFGDSHSVAPINMINELAFINDLSIFYTGYGGCIPFLNVHININYQQEDRNCYDLNNKVKALASSNNEIKGIILMARWSYYTKGEYDKGVERMALSKFGPYSEEVNRATFKEGLSKTVNFYQNLKIPIYIFSQVPQQKVEAQSAYWQSSLANELLENSLSKLSIPSNEFYELEKFEREEFLKLSDKITYYYIAKEFCDAKICSIGNPNMSFYEDDDHISGFGATKLKPFFNDIFIRSKE